MSKSLEQEFFEKFIKFGVLPVLAIFGFLLLIFLPLQHFSSKPEPSQPECRVIAKERNQFDIRCTQPTEESQPPKINTSLRRALFDKE
jgi:hypothetical protein